MQRTMRKAHTFLLAAVILFSFNLKAQTQVAESGSSVSSAEAAEALRFHNEARTEVGVAPLTWSATLAAYAQAWADQLAATGCKPGHRPRQGEWKQVYGENISWGKGQDYLALDASKSWYSEKKEFTYGPLSSDNWYPTGHYTQMVWRNTKQVGIGKANCPDGTMIVVANYNPAGNILGQKPY
jgi:uncharacterized protein YkwD